MKLNWGAGIAAIYIIFAGSMILFAVTASKQNYDLVSNDYYDQAVKYQSTIDAKNNANQSRLIRITFSSIEGEVIISADSISPGINGTLFFYKPDKASDDFKVPFYIERNTLKKVSVKQLAHGYWNLSLKYNVNNRDYFYEQKIFIP